MRIRRFLVGLVATSTILATMLAAGPGTIAAADETWGTLQIDDDAAYATSTSVSLTALLAPTDLVIDRMAISNDGDTWTEVMATDLDGYAWVLPSGDGSKGVAVRWHDSGTDQWSPLSYDYIYLDTTIPTATAPRHKLSNQQIRDNAAGVWLQWSGADVSSGREWYELQRSVNGGPWVTLYDHAWQSLTVTSQTERTYRYQVRAVDAAGHQSAWATADSFRLTRISDHNARITYGGAWTTVSSPNYWLGAAKRSGQAGARATLAFTGKSVAWVASQGVSRGQAEVWLDGAKATTIDLHANSGPDLDQQVVWTAAWPAKGAHTVQLRVLGTAGHPYVDLDAFVVLE